MARTEFSGFNDGELRTIATRLGFDESAPLSQLSRFLSANPAKARQFMKVQNRAVKKMAVGGVVDSTRDNLKKTTTTPLAQQYGQGFADPEMSGIQNIASGRLTSPGDFMPEDSRLQAQAIDGTDASQYIAQGAGQAAATAPTATASTVTDAQGNLDVTKATADTSGTANTVDKVAQSADSLAGTLSQNTAAQGTVGR